MRHSSATLEALHRLSMRNRGALQDAHACGCFHCLRAFEVQAITDWTDGTDGGEPTALCPHCGVDSVVPSRDGSPVDKDLLAAMHTYWFGRSSQLPESSLASAVRLRIAPVIRRLTWDLWTSRKDAG